MARRKESSSLTLLQITDTHLHAAAGTRLRGVNTERSLLSVLEHAQLDSRWPPDAILVTGDIVHDGSRAGYERFKATLAAFGLPVMCIPGNHDDPKLMEEVLGEVPFAVGGSIRLDSWSFVLLDSTVDGEEGGGLGVRRRAGLKAALHTEIGQHVMVCMHHHPIPMGSAYLDSSELRDGAEFLEIIDGYANVRGVVWGHVHQASDRQRGKVRFLSTPSTGSQFRPNTAVFALDDRPPGLRWLKLDPDGTIDTVVDWVETGEAPA